MDKEYQADQNSLITNETEKKDTEKMPSTAYAGEAATTYDEIRFSTKQGNVFNDLELCQLNKAVSKLSPNASVLEVGCGTARFSQRLAKQGFMVVASDPSPDMLQLAEDKCKSLKNIEFVFAVGASLQFPTDFFDFVFAIRVMNSTESEDYAIKTISEMIRVTKRGGLILVEFANKSRPLAKHNNSIRLSFNQIMEIARAKDCFVIKESGILVFSETFLNMLPAFLLPFWKIVELVSAKVFWRMASRGYVLLRKCN